MTLTLEKTIEEISSHIKTKKDRLIKNGVISYLKEQKRKIIMDKFDIFNRYNVKSTSELEEKIKDNIVQEHPAWEDLISLENMESKIDELEQDIRNIQEAD